MSSPDDRHGVEFLDAEPSDGADEELEQPAERAWLRKARLPLLVAAAVALVAVVVANVLTGSHGTPAAGPATVTATPTPSSTPTSAATSGSVVLRLPAGRSVELPRGELTCRIATACAVELDTPLPKNLPSSSPASSSSKSGGSSGPASRSSSPFPSTSSSTVACALLRAVSLPLSFGALYTSFGFWMGSSLRFWLGRIGRYTTSATGNFEGVERSGSLYLEKVVNA